MSSDESDELQEVDTSNTVYLNCYDLPYLGFANRITKHIGIPAFHTGVQVYGKE